MARLHLLQLFGEDSIDRVETALGDFKKGKGVIVVDNENRENEGDIIFPAETITVNQMAMLVRECTGIVCVCIMEERANELDLPHMVAENTSAHNTAFTVSVDARHGTTTGVSAADRVKTVKVLADDASKPGDLTRPGHMFPLIAKPNGVLEREGHTEAAVDLARLAGFKPIGVICELTAPDGEMARLPRVCSFAMQNDMTVLSIEDLIEYRKERNV